MFILIPMVGDLFHYGHINLMKNVKKKYPNCKIIIGLHTNESVKKYKREPILNYNERYNIIESCKYVDRIISFDCDIIINYNYLIENNIDLIVHAHDDTLEENEKYKQLYINIPGKFDRFDYTKGISSTQIIDRVISHYLNK